MTALSRRRQKLIKTGLFESLQSSLALRLTREASLEEKEIWPEFFWAFASLARAGYQPVQALAALEQTYAQRQEPQGFKEHLKQGAKNRAEKDITVFLREAVRLGTHGYSLTKVLERIELTRAHSAVRLKELTACLTVSEHSGAPLAQVLENLARYCEKDIDAELARDSAMSAPVTTGKILSLLPLLGLALGILMGTDPLGVLFGSIPGAILALLGAGLAYSGRRWTRRLVAEAEEKEEL